MLKVIYIITPCLDSAQTIDRTITSIISQPGKFCIRYHVQDGGSTDGTIDKLKYWQGLLEDGLYPIQNEGVQFSFSSTKDEGLYDAIDRAVNYLDIPTSASMTWVNADDILLPGAIATVLEIFNQHSDINWVTGVGNVINEQDMVVGPSWEIYPDTVIKNGLCDGIHWRHLQQEGTFWKKSLWDGAGGINRNLRLAGDWDLWRRFASITKCYQVNWPLACFRKRENQLSTQKTGLSYEEEVAEIIPIEARENCLSEIIKQGIENLHANTITCNINEQKYRIIRDKISKSRIPHVTKKYLYSDDGFDIKTDKTDEESIAEVDESVKREPAISKKFLLGFLLRYLGGITFLKDISIKDFTTKYYLIEKSGLFFRDYYKEMYDVIKMEPLTHYLKIGVHEGLNPNPVFNTSWYFNEYPDVHTSGINPLLHYIVHGAGEGRDPGPDFSTSYYKKTYMSGFDLRINPLSHYFKVGVYEGFTLDKVSQYEDLKRNNIRMIEEGIGISYKEKLRQLLPEEAGTKYSKFPSVHTGLDEFGIILYGHTRALYLSDVLKSLQVQDALKYVDVWLDGYQGSAQTKTKTEYCYNVVKNYNVNKIYRHNGGLGFRKMILQSLSIAIQKYRYIMILEDDCFPTRDAVEIFREQLELIENDDEVFSIYGHHFGTPNEGDRFTRFQGWGWGTTAEKLEPFIKLLIDCYSLTEDKYLNFVNAVLTSAVLEKIDVTPPRQPSFTLKKFFAWDETLTLLTALDNKVHMKTPKRTIYNFGYGGGSTHFEEHDIFLNPPFNLVEHRDIWTYF